MTWFRELHPEWQMLVIVAAVIVAVGLVGWLVVSIGEYRAVVAAEFEADDSAYRAQGHVPAETDTEITTVIAPVHTTQSGSGYYALLRHEEDVLAAPTTTGGGHPRPHDGAHRAEPVVGPASGGGVSPAHWEPRNGRHRRHPGEITVEALLAREQVLA